LFHLFARVSRRCAKSRFQKGKSPRRSAKCRGLKKRSLPMCSPAQAYLKSSQKGKKKHRRIVSFKYIIKNFAAVPKKLIIFQKFCSNITGIDFLSFFFNFLLLKNKCDLLSQSKFENSLVFRKVFCACLSSVPVYQLISVLSVKQLDT
jgi:hypothetical protein